MHELTHDHDPGVRLERGLKLRPEIADRLEETEHGNLLEIGQIGACSAELPGAPAAHSVVSSYECVTVKFRGIGQIGG